MIKKKIRIFEGFAGYGGGSFGLKRLKENMPEIEFEVVAYSEFDKYASALFDANHKDAYGNPIRNWGDITKIDPYNPELPDLWEDSLVNHSLLPVCRWEQKTHMAEVQCLVIL